ncbi:hypothetical protein M0R45_019579 [Rubus argutus]|uniref:Uncharacterized protein n=1 Tax=Rubus argutus TaxID=59490 RepID=A0AAW1X6N2_RUBAR
MPSQSHRSSSPLLPSSSHCIAQPVHSFCHRRSQGGFATPKSGHPSSQPSLPLRLAAPRLQPSQPASPHPFTAVVAAPLQAFAPQPSPPPLLRYQEQKTEDKEDAATKKETKKKNKEWKR